VRLAKVFGKVFGVMTRHRFSLPEPVMFARARRYAVSLRNAAIVRTRRVRVAQCLVMVIAALTIGSVTAAPGLPEAERKAIAPAARIVISDPRTDQALFGYDPIAYFIDQQAVRGRAEWSVRHGGLMFHFVSEANREMFLRAPDQFLPRIAGFDPVRLAKGFAVVSDPKIFVVRGRALWLFRDAQARDTFLSDASIETEALAQWKTSRFIFDL
jgi:YHS domain-containing protein